MRRKGFTTIEMIIVVILIGVIAAIGFPRLRDGLEKQNVRSAKALIATMVATARGAAIQRGCAATLNMTVDSAWVTACGVNPPAANVRRHVGPIGWNGCLRSAWDRDGIPNHDGAGHRATQHRFGGHQSGGEGD